MLQHPLDHPRYRHLVFEGIAAPGPSAQFTARKRGNPLPVRGTAARAVPAHNEHVGEAEAAFLRSVFALAGLDIRRYRLGPLCRRLPACVRALRCASLEQATARLLEDPEKLVVVLNTLMIGVSSFFRDQVVFEHLGQQLLPRLLQESRPLRVWSVACSHGAELYSVAMQLAEQHALEHAQLYGTDCRAAAIASATLGEYQHDAIDGLPVEARNRFFIRRGRHHILSPLLRNAVRWEVRDVFSDGQWGTWDLILCRNLAIYLEESATNLLWQRVAEALRPGGILVAGKAEKPTVDSLTRVGLCIFQKT